MVVTGTNEQKIIAPIIGNNFVRLSYSCNVMCLSVDACASCSMLYILQFDIHWCIIIYWHLLKNCNSIFAQASVSYNLIILICDLVTVGLNWWLSKELLGSWIHLFCDIKSLLYILSVLNDCLIAITYILLLGLYGVIIMVLVYQFN